MAKDVRRALMVASEPLKVPSTYASMDPDARAAWKSDQMAREGHGSFSPPGTPEREENFNRWHGNSKIRDSEGKPLRLYHATPKSFDTFLPGGPNPPNEMPSGPATWLSPYPDKQPAGHHVGGYEDKFKSGANVMPVHADIRNPLVIDNKTMRDWARQSYAKGSGEFPLLISPESRKMLLEDGYDGILWAGFGATSKDEAFYDDHGIGEHPDKSEEIIALHPPGRAQIKSAIGNRGQYDPEDTHVNYAHGGSATKRALMIARDHRNLLRRIANIYHGPGGGMDPSPGGGGYSGPGGGKYIGPSHYAEGGKVEPTEAQKHAGNYRKQHLSFHGLPISIETPKGAKREGVDPNGKAWSVTMPADYGYIKRTEGADGDHVDVYLGPERHSQMVFLINQHDHMTSRFDEHKVMLGYTSERAAVDAYEKAFSDGKGRQRIGSVEPMSLDAFKHWLKNGRTTKPAKTKHIIESRIARATGGSVPPFKLHSGAAKLIAAKGQAKATPQQYAAMPGVKPDELKHSKFDTLGSKALPREEVIKHLEDNAVPLQESVLRHYEGDYVPHDDVREDDGDSKYHEYQLPGSQNYREVLLHTPAAHTPSPELEKARARAEAATRAFDDALNDQLSSPNNADDEAYHRASAEVDAARIALARLERADKSAASNAGFRGGHWDQPNVLAHLRMSDRRGPNGEKILHLEEAQSDWGQQARDKGIAKSLEPAESAELDDLTKRAGAWGGLRPRERQRHAELLEKRRIGREGVSPGPYVDNTQKWTDLALKRVLHEAAHGGYDKIVVTPGDEQNKRYDLSSQVKNINYFPDIGYLHAETHDGKGIEHEDVKPEDLSKHIGKEAADRILKQGLQRHEGRGKLGGEFYHELEGNDLKMGGAGMRGYYDNILPKRLQALAQQHDPQAKVNLHAHPLKDFYVKQSPGYQENDFEAFTPDDASLGAHPTREAAEAAIAQRRATPGDETAPLHSLDVTPQMRDSIKQGGFNSFKRGGEVGDDPIKNWQWRPTEDVRNELQLDEIPSHVHKFGEFMDETARRAATQGLTPRDLIKAYAITRSSIGRGALPVATVRRPKNPEYGFDALPKGLQGTLRPEGAMGHWLHTKMGQRYLDEAEAGRVDEEAVRDAIKSMGAFGLPDTAEGKALRWAPKNLPGQEGRVSELIARAHRGQSSPEEWRGEMRVPGIAESKAGFFASMLGRGDQPTLDARQIILHTGRPTKEAAPILGRKGAADAAVNRLADRQTELGFKHDKSMSPFYQHLAHHAIWDKTGGEETTHDDLMQALRGAKDGGRQGYASGGGDKPLSLIASHPVVQGLSMALPSEADLQQLLRKAGIVRPYNQPSQGDVEKALKIAQTYAMPLGVGSKDDPSAYYGVKQPIAARDVTTKATATKGFSLKPEKTMTWKEFTDIGKGGHVVNLSGDRTRFGTLQEINGKPLNWPVKVYAGPDYIREPVKGRAWASAPGVISGLNRTVTDLSKKGPVFGMYSPYGGGGGDFAHHMFDAVMAQVDPSQISKGAKKQFDAAMRSASFIMGQTDKDKSKRERVRPRMAEWPGIDDPKAASEFARKKLTGDHRKAILEYLDKKSWTDEGFPHVGMTRVAVTDPKLMGVPQNVIGGNVALLKPSDKPLSSKHTSYAAGQPGEYVGTLPFAPRQYALPVSTAHFLQTPSAGKGVHVDPYSLNDKARGGYRTLFERNYVPEPVSQQMAEGAEEGIMKKPLYGLKTGGRVGYADGGGIDQLLQNLKGSFGQLNQQVAAPQASANYQAMTQQATGQAPNDAYQRMLAQALNGKTYEEMFPTAAKPAAPAAAAPAAVEQPVQTADASSQPFDYGSWMTSLMGGGGDGLKRGGKVNIVERALAVTRRK